ncbi:MAG: hypothetical protein WCS52_19120 [bacterium]
MKKMRHALVLCIASLGLSMIALCGEEERTRLNTDQSVIKALGREPTDHGSLNELIEKNRLPVDGRPNGIGVFLKQVGLDPEKIVKIEGRIKIRGSIKRIRVSPRYEIWLQGEVYSDKEIITKASVVPYSEKLFGYKITNREDWNNVIFSASGAP